MSENKKIEKIVGVKGMNDLLPSDSPLWELFENTVQSVLKSYGFQQIRTPIVEATPLLSTISFMMVLSACGTPVLCFAMSVLSVVAIASSIRLVQKRWALAGRILMRN